MRFIAVLNSDGGTLQTVNLDELHASARATFERHGHVLDWRVVHGAALETALWNAAGAENADAVLAGGGDGTISTAAGIAFQCGKPLAVLPAGTMNLFARALGVPLVLTEALEAIASGRIESVDIATANDRAFVHQFGVGLHARLVRIRDRMSYRSRLGKMLASLRAIGATMMNPPQFEAEFRISGSVEKRRVSGIAVSNNPLGSRHIYAEGLKAGVLGIYVAAPMSTWALLQLTLGLVLGTWRDNPMISEKEVEEVTLHFPKRKRGAQAVIDGELIELDRSVTLKVHPGGLKVIVPEIPPAPK